MAILRLSGSGKVREQWEFDLPSVHTDAENAFLQREEKKNQQRESRNIDKKEETSWGTV